MAAEPGPCRRFLSGPIAVIIKKGEDRAMEDRSAMSFGVCHDAPCSPRGRPWPRWAAAGVGSPARSMRWREIPSEESFSGMQAMDFPPGDFTDEGHYQISDFHGKMLILFFFQAEDAQAQQFITKNIKVFDSYANKPVRFIGVATGNPDFPEDIHAEGRPELPGFHGQPGGDGPGVRAQLLVV